MTEMTAIDLAQPALAPSRTEPSDRGADWPLAALFFAVVLSMYAALAYGAYALLA